MTLTVRSATVTDATTKGSALTHAEMDENFNHLRQSSNHSFTQSGTGAVSLSMQTAMRQFVTPEMFGAVGDGATDDSTAWANALARIASGGTLICAPQANYHFTSQVTVTGPATERICIQGYGAEISTAGAISGLKITGGDSTGGVTVLGLRINHRGNADATYGFDIIESWRAHLYDCFVEAHGVGASYAAFHLANGDAADNATGSFWTRLINCGCRKRSGGDSGDITIGVLLEGAANATNIAGGAFGNTTTGIKITYHSGQTYIANSVLIDGVAFEGFTTAIHAEQDTSVAIVGLRVIGCRAETGTTFVSLTGATSQPITPTYLAGNYLVGGGGGITYLNNPNSLYTIVLDGEVGAGGVTPTINSNDGVTVRSLSGSAHTLTLRTQGGGRGLNLLNSSGNSYADIAWSGTGVGGLLRGKSPDYMDASGIRSITGVNTAAPTSGTYALGNLVFNSGPAQGEAAGWICTSAGTPGTFVNVGGIPLVNTTAVGNVGADEDDLQTVSLPAKSLISAGSGIRITAWGTTANNSNTKEVKLYLGTAVIITTALTVSQAGVWRITAEVFSTGTDAQQYASQLIQGGATTLVDAEQGTATQDDGAAITIKCTGTVVDGGGGVNNDDIVQEGLIVELLR